MNILDKKIMLWFNVSLATIVLMVFIGGLTRLNDAGLSMTTWKPLKGVLPPLNKVQWIEEFNNYKKYPEYINYNSNMNLKEFKHIYYWEYIHRVLGRVIGLLFLIPFIYFCFTKKINNNMIVKLLFLFVLGLLQAILGWYMVVSGLGSNPDVSHFRLAAHLILAFFILSYLFWLKLSIENNEKLKIEKFNYFNSYINLILFVCFIQILFGAFTAGLKAGHFWNTFPLIENHFLPKNIFKDTVSFYSLLNNPKYIQLVHRILGIMLLILISCFVYKTSILRNEIKNNAMLMLMFILSQFILGVLTLISKVSIVFASLHQVFAIFLLFAILKTKYSLSYINKNNV